MNVDFPAPEGPMMATSSPLLNFPEIPFRRVLYPVKSRSHSFANQDSLVLPPVPQRQTRSTLGCRTKAKGKVFHTMVQRSPTFLAPGTGFVGDNFSTDGGGDGFGMIQAHSIYCALYFYYYYSVIYREIIIQLTTMQNQWEA